jgi:hypothetical protein
MYGTFSVVLCRAHSNDFAAKSFVIFNRSTANLQTRQPWRFKAYTNAERKMEIIIAWPAAGFRPSTRASGLTAFCT